MQIAIHFIRFFFIAMLLTAGMVIAAPVSELKSDESLVFFNTSAWLNTETDQWHVPIHGWILEPEDSTVRKGLIAAAFKASYDLETNQHTQANFDDRVNWLLADNESNKSIVIRFANRTYAISESASNGHFSSTLKVDSSVLDKAGISQVIKYQAVLSQQDARSFSGQVHLIKPTGLSIISDIDDTIKISDVTDRKKLLKHTFYQDFTVVAGMADLYQKQLNADGALHFVSSSPWQLYPALEPFIEEAGFPHADYALKSFRFKDSSLLNLFASSLETKPPQITAIIKKYPGRKFILVGDSGENDPEVYAKIQQMFPNQVIKILIRNVTDETADNARFQSIYKELNPNKWQLFNSAEEINAITSIFQ